MKAVVEVVSGSRRGERFVLRAGQRIEFGRSNRAEVVCPDDEQISSRHFRVSTDEKACYLQDLGSTNGTRVNEQAASSVVLRGGDVITAGRTRFRVHIEGDSPDEAFPPKPVKVQLKAAHVGRQTIERVVALYMMQECQSGLTLCRGNLEHVPPVVLCEMLAFLSPLSFLINFSALGLSPEKEVRQSDYLFDWLGPEAAVEASPVLVAAADVEDWRNYVNRGWQHDALVCLFSKKEKGELLSQLRSSSRAQVDADDTGQGVLGFAWPSVMSPLLESSQGDLVKRVLDGIDAVLLEDQEHVEHWQLFGGTELPELLSRFGMVEAPAEIVLPAGAT